MRVRRIGRHLAPSSDPPLWPPQIARVRNQLEYLQAQGRKGADAMAAKAAELERERQHLEAARADEARHAAEGEAAQVRCGAGGGACGALGRDAGGPALDSGRSGELWPAASRSMRLRSLPAPRPDSTFPTPP